MNKIEKIVYDVLKNNPRMKNAVRNFYQSCFDLLPDKKDFFICKPMVKEGYFLGFHDICPFSSDEQMILSNKLMIGLHMPKISEGLEVGFFSNKMQNYNKIKVTHAWNYHKGCRLQWLGNDCSRVIFNDIVNNKLGSVVYSISDKSFHYLNYPIDSVSHDGRFATSFSYERLNRYMPGYGYTAKDEPYFDEDESENTGLFIVDVKSGERRLSVSLKQLADFKPEKTMENAHHYVTHTQFSPDGQRIAFLHRWTFDDPDKRWTRLVTCKTDGSDLFVSNTTGMVSHFDWDEKHGILAYCQVNNIDGHYIFPTYKMNKSIRVGSGINSDGHQSYIPNTDLFITDTYPDRRRYAKLYKVDINNNTVTKIADVKSIRKFQSPDLDHHWACDLHPRVSPSGRYVCFDSVHTGKRALCIMKIK